MNEQLELNLPSLDGDMGPEEVIDVFVIVENMLDIFAEHSVMVDEKLKLTTQGLEELTDEFSKLPDDQLGDGFSMFLSFLQQRNIPYDVEQFQAKPEEIHEDTSS